MKPKRGTSEGNEIQRMCMYTFCYTKSYKMLTIRTDEEIDLMIAYLRNHKVRFPRILREAIRKELTKLCTEFEMEKEKEYLPF